MRFIVRYKKLLVISVSAIVLGLFIWFTVDYAARNATIIVEYTPSSSSVKINGRSASANNRIRPGQYTVEVIRDGFESYSETVTVDKGQTSTIYAVLESNREDTADWYKEHPQDAKKREQILDARFTTQSAEIEKNFPISAVLPYIPPRGAYRIDYGAGSEPGSQAVYISYYTEVGKKLAEERIVEMGYKLEDYEIIYRKENYEAPSAVEHY